MAVTVEQLVEQHRRCERAKADLESDNYLYPDGSSPLANTFFEMNIKQAKKEADKMRALMAEATPEQIEEARRVAREKP